MQRVWQYFSNTSSEERNNQELESLLEPEEASQSAQDNAEQDIEAGRSSDDCGEFLEECCTCGNVVCVCSFCVCVPFFTMSGLLGGCYAAVLLDTKILALWGMNAATSFVTCVPLSSMLGGYGIGAWVWGALTDKATAYEREQVAQGNSPSVFAFFRSCGNSTEVQAQITAQPALNENDAGGMVVINLDGGHLPNPQSEERPRIITYK